MQTFQAGQKTDGTTRDQTDAFGRFSFAAFLAFVTVASFAFAAGLSPIQAVGQDEQAEPKALWDAARKGELERVKELIEAGVDVNSATQYQATALSYASGRGHKDVVEYLLEKGADPSTEDTFYHATPMSWAVMNGHLDILQLLLKAGADGADDVLQNAIIQGRRPLFEAIVEADVISAEGVLAGRRTARVYSRDAMLSKLESLDVDETLAERKLEQESLTALTGTYSGEGLRVVVDEADGELSVAVAGQRALPFFVIDDQTFRFLSTEIRFEESEPTSDEGTPEMVAVLKRQENEFRLAKGEVERTEPADEDMPNADVETNVNRDVADQFRASPTNWPSFRGLDARGISESDETPLVWDSRWGMNTAWKVPVEGLALSCPVVWGDRLFVTTAISTEDKAGLRIGNYGDVDSVEDNSEHEFKLLCFDKTTGETLWERTAHVGVPRVKRHLKSSHANPTPVTDGKYIVASFGSEGLYCYDIEGNLAWRRDFGILDSGWFFDPSYQWGFGSSPVIRDGVVYIQCDVQEGSFVAALDLQTGSTIWQTERDEIPTWSTPTIINAKSGPTLVTNGSRAARAYDARNGELLWEIKDHSEIVVPTPFVAKGRVIITSGYRPIQPIYAINPDAIGLLNEEQEDDATSDQGSKDDSNDDSDNVYWSKNRGGPYMPTPIAVDDMLFTCANNGIIACYDLITGKQHFRKRLSVDEASSFVASPIALNGYIYLTSEQGAIVVLRASKELEVVSVNHVGEACLATPAISDGMLYFRGEKHLIAIKHARAPRP